MFGEMRISSLRSSSMPQIWDPFDSNGVNVWGLSSESMPGFCLLVKAESFALDPALVPGVKLSSLMLSLNSSLLGVM